MQAFIASLVATLALAAGAAWYLDSEVQSTSASAFTSGSAARVGDPGENLVGPNWTGQPNG